MKKPQSINFISGLLMIFFLMGAQSIFANSTSIANWPDKEKSIKLIHQMIEQARAEFASEGRASNSREQIKYRYLTHLADLVRGTSNDVQTSFDKNHSRHIDQSNLTQSEIDTYNTIRDEIVAYVLIAG